MSKFDLIVLYTFDLIKVREPYNLYFEFLVFSLGSVLRELSQPNVNLKIYIYSQDPTHLEREVRMNYKSPLISFHKIDPSKYDFNTKLVPVSNIVVKQFESFTCHSRFFIIRELLLAEPNYNILYLDDDAAIGLDYGARIIAKLPTINKCMTSNVEHHNYIREWFVGEYQRLTNTACIENDFKVRSNFCAMIAIKHEHKEYENQYEKKVLNNGIMYCPQGTSSEVITECIDLYRDLHSHFSPFIYNDQLAVSFVYQKIAHNETMFDDEDLRGIYHFYCEKYSFPDEMRKLFTIIYKSRLTNKPYAMSAIEPYISTIEKAFPTFRCLFDNGL
jgi:hypothetical protein